jgi:tRNA-specific 2-thiouridylase
VNVLVAMSGGVDSSVAAALLQQEGHAVTGVTMKLWGGESDTGCCSISDTQDARRVADRLGIDHHTFNFGDDFDRHVVAPYVAAHEAGRTPNPCIECNRHIKFDRLLERATALGFDALATGHHARVATTASGSRRVARGADRAKDQSYVLHMLGQQTLSRLLLPVGEINKDRARALAAELDLRVATKPDSQDVCFITRSEGRAEFLGRRITPTPGVLIDGSHKKVGAIDAVELVTVGQRKGLGLGGQDEPLYAVDVDLPAATVTVGPRADLDTASQALADLVWVDGHHHVDGNHPSAHLEVQTSAHGGPRRGAVVDGVLNWAEPSRRVAPGQSIVFYIDDQVVGGATAS